MLTEQAVTQDGPGDWGFWKFLSLSLFSFFGCGPGFKDVPQPGIEPMPLTSPALAGEFFITSATWETQIKKHSK